MCLFKRKKGSNARTSLFTRLTIQSSKIQKPLERKQRRESDSEEKFQKKIVYQGRSKLKKKNEIDYSSLSMICDRFGISDRAEAAIVSSEV